MLICTYLLKSIVNKMADIYDDVCVPTKPYKGKKEVVYDYPTGVGIGEDEIATRRVEITSNPAYGTVICSEECVSANNLKLYLRLLLISCFQSQQLLIWWMNMTVNCLNSKNRGYMTIPVEVM